VTFVDAATATTLDAPDVLVRARLSCRVLSTALKQLFAPRDLLEHRDRLVRFSLLQ
jgi:hypothetical protein